MVSELPHGQMVYYDTQYVAGEVLRFHGFDQPLATSVETIRLTHFLQGINLTAYMINKLMNHGCYPHTPFSSSAGVDESGMRIRLST